MVNVLEKDRIVKYFEKHLGKFLFVEFSNEFMKKLDIENVAKDIRVPIRPDELESFAGGEGVSIVKIAETMVFVLGCDPNFKYAEGYKKVIKMFFDENVAKDILAKGVQAVNNKDLEYACIHFRAAISMDSEMMEGLYNYGRVCMEMYKDADNNEYVGRFKAEAIDVFEVLTIKYNDFDQPFYFLGYLYLNMGLYEKAGLAWEKYILVTKDRDGAREIGERLGQIAEPRRIEEGCNYVISGRYQDGLNILISFLNSNYDTWWPLHFYIATAYFELGNDVMAENEYKKTLQLSASNMDAIEGLIKIYENNGDVESLKKYKKKKEIILENYNKE